MIRRLTKQDADSVLEIYSYGIRTRLATFETETPAWEEWDVKHHAFCRLVFEDQDVVRGWAALVPFSSRRCYKGVAESSVYVAEQHTGRGIGSQLMEKMIAGSEQHGIWTLTSSVFPENEASVRLHLKFGYREVGVREKIAKLDGVWRDTLILERRSDRIF